MELCKTIGKMPWPWVAYFYITSMVIGVSVGSPVAAKYYQLSRQSEVDALFFLTAVVDFYLLLPLCIVAAVGIRHPQLSEKKYLKWLYIVLCTILIPILFYGITVGLYYA